MTMDIYGHLYDDDTDDSADALDERFAGLDGAPNGEEADPGAQS